ncbi:alpha/beta hydrolase [Limosilactobacillus equigenerosi]|uniref:Alpha beta fold family hydrolase n=1 Tax=Limosilactobacillus equigenerosi DSM 18793 = JCM 14505 TaxID=1423742 RepID=A0A0R1UK16_9LACO|nr:alpha/beta fold hydrolase [Limosilactobacillus equigenerosi]KRL93252.1 Alpha beta fold family hydrolase [Limosilactobacillus equigenerosi DSM 18793 = JCM 14505]
MQYLVQRAGLTLRGELTGPQENAGHHLAILFHGFKGDIGHDQANLLFDLKDDLNAAGIPTLRMNFNGCGDSDGDFADMTVLNEIDDAIAILKQAIHDFHPARLTLIGHSQGGVVASMVAAYYHDLVDDLVLLAPAATLVDDANAGVCQGVTYDPNHIPESIDVDGFTVGGAYFRTAQRLHIYETAAGFTKPVLLIHGTADQIVNYQASIRYDQIYANSTLHLIDGASHRLIGPGTQRSNVKQLVVNFVTH